jgi:adenosylcobinamide-GDP ribazoletransferase
MCLNWFSDLMQSESDGRQSSAIGSGYEVVLALATLTLWPILDERAVGSPAQRARALVFTPIIGFFAGVLLGLFDHALTGKVTVGTRSFAIVTAASLAMLFLQWRGIADLFEALRAGARPASTGLARIGPGGVTVAMAGFALEVLLLTRIKEPASRTAALVMSSMLARWSIVPVAYGLKAGERWGLGLPFEGGIEFREFAISSVIALGLTLALYADVGLVVTVVVAVAILGLRFLLSRRFGGVPGFALAGASAIIEIAVIVTVATLST